MSDKNIHKRDFKFSFAIKHDLRLLKKAGKISDSQIYTFKMEAKDFFSKLCNDILQESFKLLFCTMHQITQPTLSCRSTCIK